MRVDILDAEPPSTEPVADRRRRSGGQLKCRWAVYDGRQQQLQTSTCRRRDHDTRSLKLRAAGHGARYALVTCAPVIGPQQLPPANASRVVAVHFADRCPDARGGEVRFLVSKYSSLEKLMDQYGASRLAFRARRKIKRELLRAPIVRPWSDNRSHARLGRHAENLPWLTSDSFDMFAELRDHGVGIRSATSTIPAALLEVADRFLDRCASARRR